MLGITFAPMLRALGALALIAASPGVLDAADGNVPGELVDATKFRVCADPDNLPYSNEAGEGFENKIAELLAGELGREITYSWYPSTIGFVRNTLAARICDVVIGTTIVNELMQNTNPYYRSTYALIQRADASHKILSLDDPALKDMRIGGVANTPPITLLATRGLLGNLAPYQLMADTRYDHPAQNMVEDVETGEIDIAVVWGPIGGYFAKQADGAMAVTPLKADDGSPMRLDFRISMGLRRGEPIWKEQLNDLLREQKPAIEAILQDYGVPLLDNQGNPIAAEEQQQGGLVPEPDGYRMADFRAPVPATLSGADVLSTEQLRELVEAEAPLLIDVMPAPRKPKDTDLWIPPTRDNILGSHWLANTGYGELSDEFSDFFKQELAALTANDPGRRLVFYCEADCWMSWNAAKRALALGYEKVAWYPDGTDGWKAAGLPLESAEPAPMPDFLPVTDGSNRTAKRRAFTMLVAD
ncbi:MAG: quinoprotein dehydrogenase-associated putative ABC transporter substrate-binding protein [Alphaproteobacteria bacterium]|nr:quinoprotein dehydrogenase-associated putative ABC transporter substrate-binding protein [Alphaproteobacteria bacterium]